MNDIDSIMDMLDWNNDAEVQKAGREMAKEVRCINVFLQPGHAGHRKNVWDNCALVLAERSDAELEPYLHELFRWLQDMNWPGAEIIRNRLQQYERTELFEFTLAECIKEADALHEENWLNTLKAF